MRGLDERGKTVLRTVEQVNEGLGVVLHVGRTDERPARISPSVGKGPVLESGVFHAARPRLDLFRDHPGSEDGERLTDGALVVIFQDDERVHVEFGAPEEPRPATPTAVGFFDGARRRRRLRQRPNVRRRGLRIRRVRRDGDGLAARRRRF